MFLLMQANNILRAMYMQWMVGRYCKSLSPSRRHQFEMKVLAEAVFKSKLCNSPPSVCSCIQMIHYYLFA